MEKKKKESERNKKKKKSFPLLEFHKQERATKWIYSQRIKG